MQLLLFADGKFDRFFLHMPSVASSRDDCYGCKGTSFYDTILTESVFLFILDFLATLKALSSNG